MLELSKNEQFLLCGISFILWFLLMFNFIIPTDGFVKVEVPRYIVVIEAVSLLAIGVAISIVSIYLSAQEIRLYIRINRLKSSNERKNFELL